mmetsp:Transcript_40056/g.63334  ORF Transcript_40056/g.63334 Transcript_40056/m.63334 type:complete len:379 (-) Transcript_40056:46-1182(-)|eukprot:CAMPEP_0201510060 /NCGR_PEP_ID=MMETSP0161_2-20130828/2909_1 /ASSEMBLY_ACC=CAM_ASM_000251 /TAXON_ID=180227 /ORGANISM="Neoparamoeba aestuarina, Strain SoJaBio B1-5/56/2" /LENGTH=378 /DNA_ID=CAMNT_0047905177 /DNA_START=114 /DNA_END=1247 /DNA_ORIENTATION=-
MRFFLFSLLLVCVVVGRQQHTLGHKQQRQPHQPQETYRIYADDPNIQYEGRYNLASTGVNSHVTFDWSGVEISMNLCGPATVGVIMRDIKGKYAVFVQTGKAVTRVATLEVDPVPTQTFDLTEGCHLVTIVKLTEAANNYDSAAYFYGFEMNGVSPFFQPFPQPKEVRRIEFLGDSITCGYGVLAPNASYCPSDETTYQLEDVSVTYEADLGRRLNTEVRVECWSGKGVVRNYGDPSTTSVDPFPIYFNRTYAVSATPLYNFSLYQPDAVHINLGTNDFSTQPNPSQDQFETGYKNYIAQIRGAYGDDIPLFLACGPLITDPCCTYVKNVADSEGATYIDLENILDYPQDYACGHPSVSGHTKMADVSEPIIASTLGW